MLQEEIVSVYRRLYDEARKKNPYSSAYSGENDFCDIDAVMHVNFNGRCRVDIRDSSPFDIVKFREYVMSEAISPADGLITDLGEQPIPRFLLEKYAKMYEAHFKPTRGETECYALRFHGNRIHRVSIQIKENKLFKEIEASANFQRITLPFLRRKKIAWLRNIYKVEGDGLKIRGDIYPFAFSINSGEYIEDFSKFLFGSDIESEQQLLE